MRMHHRGISGFIPGNIATPVLGNPITGGIGDFVKIPNGFTVPYNSFTGLSGLGAGCCGEGCGCGPCSSSGVSGLGTTATTTSTPNWFSTIENDATNFWNTLQGYQIMGIGGGVIAAGVVAALFIFKKRR